METLRTRLALLLALSLSACAADEVELSPAEHTVCPTQPDELDCDNEAIAYCNLEAECGSLADFELCVVDWVGWCANNAGHSVDACVTDLASFDCSASEPVPSTCR